MDVITFQGLGKGASIEAHVDISFGLAIGLSVVKLLETAKEIVMENSDSLFKAIMASVWCGAAFLRSLVEKLQPKREIDKC